MPAARVGDVWSAFVATAFAQEDADSAKVQWRQVADQLRPKLRWQVELFFKWIPKARRPVMDEAEHDVLAYMSFRPGSTARSYICYRSSR